MQSQAALTGVNFAVAETGEFVVCTNEGNADMGAHLANVHIACMGLEKIVPKREHLGVFFVFLQEVLLGSRLLRIPVISENQEKDRKCTW